MEMPFGKYKGQCIENIPIGYLKWVLDNCDLYDDELLEEIKARVQGASYRAKKRPHPEPEIDLTPEIVKRWHRQMALKFHPDHGGSNQAMAAINDGKDLLASLLRQ